MHTATGQDSVEDTGRSQKTALHLGEELWGLTNGAWPLDARALQGVVLHPTRSKIEEGSSKPERHGTAATPPKARLHPYLAYQKKTWQQWFAALAKSQRAPNEEQWRFLQAVADRFDSEAAESSRVIRGCAGSAPVNFAMIAPPGTGKTFCINLLVA